MTYRFPFVEDAECSATLLSKSLLKLLDVASTRPGAHAARVPVFMAYKSLLALSSAARGAALRGGLVETVCEQLRRLHTQLSMDALQVRSCLLLSLQQLYFQFHSFNISCDFCGNLYLT